MTNLILAVRNVVKEEKDKSVVDNKEVEDRSNNSQRKKMSKRVTLKTKNKDNVKKKKSKPPYPNLSIQ